MNTNDDEELRQVLREWRVPDAPDSLVPHVTTRPLGGWRAWLAGSVRVPVPVAVLFCIALLWLAVAGLRDQSPTAAPANADDLRGFEPVNAVNVRIERSGHANR
jgi:hypothetical protein